MALRELKHKLQPGGYLFPHDLFNVAPHIAAAATAAAGCNAAARPGPANANLPAPLPSDPVQVALAPQAVRLDNGQTGLPPSKVDGGAAGETRAPRGPGGAG